MPRHFAKTATYSLTHLMVAVTVAYALSNDWRVALGIGLVEPMVQTLAYVVHERVWERLPRDRRPHAATRYRVHAASQ